MAVQEPGESDAILPLGNLAELIESTSITAQKRSSSQY